MRNIKFRRILSFILALIMILTLPITAYAAGGNGSGDTGSGSGHSTVSGGASYRKAAYLIYIVDKNGSLLTPVVEVAIDGAKVPPANANFDYEKSKFGNQSPTKFEMIYNVPTPFKENGDGNGTALKNALLSKTSLDEYKAAVYIKDYFGSTVANNFINSNNSQYLIFEGVYWLTMNNGNHRGTTLVATSTGWAKAQRDFNCGDTGSRTFSKYTNNIFANCMKFEFTQLGLNPCPSGKQTNSTIMNSASGIISVWNNEIAPPAPQVQSTYDEPKGDTPASPADESDGNYTIVKNYRYSNDGGDTFSDGGCFNIQNITSKIVIENEQSYKVVGWKISDSENTNISSVNWENEVPGSISKQGTDTGTVDLSNSDKCLYVLLEKVDNTSSDKCDFELSQASLTKRIRFSSSDKTKSIKSHAFSWTSDEFTVTDCLGHGTETKCSNFKFLDDDITVSLRNENAAGAKDIIVQKNGWQNIVKSSSLSNVSKYWHKFKRGLTSKSTLSRSGWDYISVLWRGQDKLTIAQWKNSESTNNLMSSIGFAVDNKPVGNRMTSDYVNTFTAKFSEDMGANRETNTKYGASVGSIPSNKICTQTKGYSFKADTALSLSNISVKVKVYSGKSDLGSTSAEIKKNQVEVGKITFYPYIKMKYDTYNMPYKNNYGQNAYVLGNYARTLSLKNFCQISFSEDKDNSLEVNSSQWSTHVRTNNNLNSLLGTSDETYKILPGGTILSVQNRKDENDEYITKDVNVTTYQCILEGDGKVQVDNTGSSSGDLTETTAKNNHAAAVDSVTNGLKGLGLDLYGNNSAKKQPFNGENITESKKFNGQALSTSAKYNWDGDFSGLYLNAEAAATSYNKYTFSTDTEGNIRMNGAVILKRGQNVSSLSDKTAKTINNKTGIVDQLANSLERNTGSDKSAVWASGDGKWYNEAFDGITVLVSATPIHVGYWDSIERTTVFDTVLTPIQSDTSDIGQKFNVFQMKTKEYSSVYAGEKNRLGDFMGIKVYSSVDLDKLYKTDKWFSSNITASDLK